MGVFSSQGFAFSDQGKWPETGPPLLWKTSGLGNGYSSVAIGESTIYTMGSGPDAETVIALRRNDGRKVWSTEIGEKFEKNSGYGPRSTPTTRGEHVYALSALGELACLDRETGTVVWQKNIYAEYGGRHPSHGARESVLVDAGKVICAPGGSKAIIAALNSETGAEIWRTEKRKISHRSSYSSAVPAIIHGVRQYIIFTSRGLAAVRASDGSLLWEDESTFDAENCCRPVVKGDEVFYTSAGRGGGVRLRVERDGNKWIPKVVWQSDDLKAQYGEVHLRGGHLYGFNGSHAACLAWKDGEVKWDTRVKRGDGRSIDRHAITWAMGDQLVARGYSGGIVIFRMTPERFEPVGAFMPGNRRYRRTSPSEPAYPQPVVHEGKLYLRDQDELFCYDLSEFEGGDSENSFPR